jgi:hypothetical protein
MWKKKVKKKEKQRKKRKQKKTRHSCCEVKIIMDLSTTFYDMLQKNNSAKISLKTQKKDSRWPGITVSTFY